MKLLFCKGLGLADSLRNIIYIDPEIYDLVPVLIDSLAAELEEMVSSMGSRDLVNLREKIHYSKGAALTFGFKKYADELAKLYEAVADQDDTRMLQGLGRLKLLLKETSFMPTE